MTECVNTEPSQQDITKHGLNSKVQKHKKKRTISHVIKLINNAST